MSLEIRHDFLNQPYVEGDVDGNHIIGEPCRDLLTGQQYGKFYVNGQEYQVEHAVDPMTKEDHFPVKAVGRSSSGSRGGGSNPIVWILGILLIPVAVGLPLVVWKSIINENIPELLYISIGSVGIAAYFILGNPMGFAAAFGCSVPVISVLFFISATVLTFVIPVPSMASSFSIGSLLAIGLIGFLASLAPSFIIAILSSINLHFRNKHQYR